MEEQTIKVDLHEKIEHADLNQLRDLYGLITNYFNGQDSTEEWDKLPELHQKLILKGLEQVEAGLGKPVKEVTERLRAKYGLNG